MYGGTKKFFSFLRNKKTLAVLFLFIIFGAILPLHFANAVFSFKWWNPVSWIDSLIEAFFRLILLLTRLLVQFSGTVLKWVTSDDFTGLSYTNPSNPIIKAGLGITQGFANVGIVLALIYIAIATILNLAGYDTKKLLTNLILIALIVNFAPVICGLIVDASNIVMNFFLRNVSENAGNFTVGQLRTAEGLDSGEYFLTNPKLFLGIFLMTIMNLGLFFGLLLFAMLFIVRYVAIWILVILSPLAFMSLAFPAGKVKSMLWDKWWDQFIQWSIIGITAGFFLYLSVFLTSQTGAITKHSPDDIGSTILPFIVPLAFLWFGLFYALTTSAMGSGAIVNFANKGRKWAQTKGKQGAKWGGRWAKTATADKIAASKTYQKVTQGMAKFGQDKFGNEEWAKKHWYNRAVAGAGDLITKPFRVASSAAGSAGMKYASSQSKSVDEQETNVEKMFGKDADKIAANYNTIKAGDWNAKLAHARKLASLGKLDKLSPENLKEATMLAAKYDPNTVEKFTAQNPALIEGVYGKDKKGNELKSNDLKNAVLNAATKGGVKIENGQMKAAGKRVNGVLTEADDKDVQELVDQGYTEAEAIEQAAFKKAVISMKEEDIEKLPKSVLNNAKFQEAVIKHKNSRFVSQVAMKDPAVAESMKKKIQQMGVVEIAKTNAELASSLAKNNPGMTLAFGPDVLAKDKTLHPPKLNLNEKEQRRRADRLIQSAKIEASGKEGLLISNYLKAEKARKTAQLKLNKNPNDINLQNEFNTAKNLSASLAAEINKNPIAKQKLAEIRKLRKQP